MEISFKKPTFENVNHALSHEWLETDNIGNYASSTILGVNTRKQHGLFVIKQESPRQNFMILSHLQEELFQGNNQYLIFNSEYESDKNFKGAGYQTAFHLDPYPTFVYEVDGIKVKKSVFLVQDCCRLIVFYKISGRIKEGSRIFIRPFFGYRPTQSTSEPWKFNNMEVFSSDKQIRYLPFQDAPEIFIFHSSGQFTNAPMWYHNFYYRFEKDIQPRKEDLLNLGFFEIPIAEPVEFYLSFGLNTTTFDELKGFHTIELQRREEYSKEKTQTKESVHYLKGKIDKFRIKKWGGESYFLSEPLAVKFNLSSHCFISRRILQSGVDSKTTERFHQEILKLLKGKNLKEVLGGMDPQISVDLASSFYLGLLIFTFHSQSKNKRNITDSLKIIQELINILLKNQLPYYRIKRSKLLDRQYRKSDLEEKYDHEMFFPLRQNLILNVFWYNLLKIGEYLTDLLDENSRKYRKYAKKLKANFFNQFIKSFSLHPSLAVESYTFAFHPSMVYAITLPFSILGEQEEQILYRVLIKQFLSSRGLKFPVRWDNQKEPVLSPLLAGEYFDAWKKLMPEKVSILTIFRRMAKSFEQSMSNGILGFIHDVIDENQEEAMHLWRASGPATSEVIYFLTTLDNYEKTAE